MRWEVSQHPATAVEEHEDWKNAFHARRPDDRERERLTVDGDDRFRDLGWRERDVDARLQADQYRARLFRSHLLHRLAAAGVQCVEKLGDAPVDVGADDACDGCGHGLVLLTNLTAQTARRSSGADSASCFCSTHERA